MTTNPTPSPTGEEVTFDVKAVGFTLNTDNAKVYGSDDVQLANSKVESIRGGIRVTGVSGSTYTIELPAAARGANMTTTSAVSGATLAGTELTIPVTGKEGVVTLTVPEPGNGTVTLDGKTIGSVEVGTFGDVKATFTIDVPTWAYVEQSPGNNLEVKYDVYVDGAPYKQVTGPVADGNTAGSDLILNSAKTQYTVTGLTIATSDLPDTVVGRTVSLVISSVNWKAAKVEFVDGTTGKELSMDYSSGKTLDYLATGTVAGNLKFAINTTSSGSATYAVEGANLVANATANLTNNAMTHVNAAVDDTTNFVAKGGEVVKVIVTGTIVPKYNIAINGQTTTPVSAKLEDLDIVEGMSANSANKNAVLSVTGQAVVDAGDNGGYVIYIENQDDMVDSMDVTYTLDGVTTTVNLNGVGNWKTTLPLVNIQANHNLTVDKIVMKPVAFVISGVDVVTSGKSITITFTEKLTGDARFEDFFSLTNGSKTNDTPNQKNDLIQVKLGASSHSGMNDYGTAANTIVTTDSLTITFDSALQDGDQIFVDAAVTSAETGKFSKSATITITKNADGTYSADWSPKA